MISSWSGCAKSWQAQSCVALLAPAVTSTEVSCARQLGCPAIWLHTLRTYILQSCMFCAVSRQ